MRDTKLIFSAEQVETLVDTHESTNVVDLTSALADVGSGTPVFLNIEIHTACVGTSSTVAFALEDSADDSTFNAVYSTPAIAEATLVAGFRVLRMPLPKGLRRYIRVSYTIGTAVLSAGKFNAYLDL